MLYELSEFYRRDVYFVYSQKNEEPSHLSVMECKKSILQSRSFIQ